MAEEIPPRCWRTQIGNWHRVRTKEVNHITGRLSGGEEIGAGNTPEKAAAEAWEWWNEKREKTLNGSIEGKK